MNYNTNNKKAARVILFIIAVMVAAGIIFRLVRSAAENRPVTMYVICQPGDYVYARKHASKSSDGIGRMECGDAIQTDGKTKNGFVHIVNAGLEESEAWIYVGYLSADKPEWAAGEKMEIIGTGRVAARKYVEGPVRKWLQPGTEVQVFYKTEEWAVTNRGFVMMKYLEVGSV